MPHYKDGTEAKVGDQVFGKLYNTPGVRAGTIISITPGVESCNAMVGFLVSAPEGWGGADPAAAGSATRMAVRDVLTVETSAIRARKMRPEAHGSAGEGYNLVECADYCAVNELTKVE